MLHKKFDINMIISEIKLKSITNIIFVNKLQWFIIRKTL